MCSITTKKLNKNMVFSPLGGAKLAKNDIFSYLFAEKKLIKYIFMHFENRHYIEMFLNAQISI